MAMIKCMECGRDISDRASVCPHCGFPIHDKIQEMAQIDYRKQSNDEVEIMKESPISIACLVCFVLGIIFSFLKASAMAFLLCVASIVLLIISHFQRDKKIICATIVFWLFTVSFIIIVVCAVVLSLVL